MPDPNQTRVQELFAEAVELPAEQRERFVQTACGSNATLLAEIKALLGAHGQAVEEFLAEPAVQIAHGTVAAYAPLLEAPGARVGRYHLLHPIGEGGFGTVFLAEQERPVRRRVALKLIKPGMDSGQVVARFEAERQALALMDHPNIAKVLDGGTTEGGHPFFVMELVTGEPITRYCEEHKLSVAERLDLLAQVCRAVQHAHTKGVIHRDIKPSNVLVTQSD